MTFSPHGLVRFEKAVGIDTRSRVVGAAFDQELQVATQSSGEKLLWRKSGMPELFSSVWLFLFLEWRDVLDNVNVGINHPYIINWIVRFGISIKSSVELGNYQYINHLHLPNLKHQQLSTLNWNQSKFDISWSNATSLNATFLPGK